MYTAHKDLAASNILHLEATFVPSHLLPLYYSLFGSHNFVFFENAYEIFTVIDKHFTFGSHICY